MKLIKAVSAVGVLFVGLSSQVQAVEIKFYGQVNQALMSADTGNGSETFIVDNDNSGTRLGLKATHELEDNWTAGAHLEFEYQSNASNKVTPTQKTIDGDFSERQINLHFSGPIGKFSIGQGDGAANGNTERDLSGTAIISWANPALLGGALDFAETSGGSNVGFSKAMSNLDFESRYDRVRYDLPEFGPFKAAISQGVKGNNDVTELGVRANFNAGGKLTTAIGYSTEDKNSAAVGDEETFGGSVSWLHANGFNLTGVYSTKFDDNPANPDAKFTSIKAGYKQGKHSVSVGYYITEDLAQLGDESTTVGLGYVYKPIKWIDMYAGINQNSLDRSGSNFDDITIATIGARVKF
ncbi:porin [Amphritea sp. HPY]|uniref:porin n=1 Tax=Amphritea sp. HPY TaxID=3421652 RepID=UPI003D7E6377